MKHLYQKLKRTRSDKEHEIDELSDDKFTTGVATGRLK